MTTNAKYYFRDTTIDTIALDVDTMQVEFDSVEDCIAAASK